MVDTYKEKKTKFSLTNNLGCNRESVAGSVIQATGMVEFEDGLWIGNHLKARNGLQRVCTIPEVRQRAD